MPAWARKTNDRLTVAKISTRWRYSREPNDTARYSSTVAATPVNHIASFAGNSQVANGPSISDGRAVAPTPSDSPAITVSNDGG